MNPLNNNPGNYSDLALKATPEVKRELSTQASDRVEAVVGRSLGEAGAACAAPAAAAAASAPPAAAAAVMTTTSALLESMEAILGPKEEIDKRIKATNSYLAQARQLPPPAISLEELSNRIGDRAFRFLAAAASASPLSSGEVINSENVARTARYPTEKQWQAICAMSPLPGEERLEAEATGPLDSESLACIRIRTLVSRKKEGSTEDLVYKGVRIFPQSRTIVIGKWSERNLPDMPDFTSHRALFRGNLVLFRSSDNRLTHNYLGYIFNGQLSGPSIDAEAIELGVGYGHLIDIRGVKEPVLELSLSQGPISDFLFVTPLDEGVVVTPEEATGRVCPTVDWDNACRDPIAHLKKLLPEDKKAMVAGEVRRYPDRIMVGDNIRIYTAQKIIAVGEYICRDRNPFPHNDERPTTGVLFLFFAKNAYGKLDVASKRIKNLEVNLSHFSGTVQGIAVYEDGSREEKKFSMNKLFRYAIS